jgi:hypothetical protein
MAQQNTIGRTATTVSTGNDGAIRVTYHGTDVVTIHPNGAIDLDTGGWFTPTTKTRMNQASNQFRLGFYVYQEEFRWYVKVDGQNIEFNGKDSLRIRNGHD